MNGRTGAEWVGTKVGVDGRLAVLYGLAVRFEVLLGTQERFQVPVDFAVLFGELQHDDEN